MVGLSFIQVRLRSAPGPLVGFPDRGHPAGLATDGEPAQDEVEGGRAHGVGVVIAEDASAAGQDVFVQLPGRLVLAQPGQRGDEVEGGPQGVGVVLAQDAAGQGVFVQLPGRLVLADRTQADSARYSRSPSPGDAPPPHPF